MKKSFIFAVLAICTSLSATVLENCTFEKKKHGWGTRKYWGGELTQQDNMLLLKSTFARKKYWGRIVSMRLSGRVLAAEKIVKITVEAKGQGDFATGFLVYYKNEKGKSAYKFVNCDPVALNDTLQKVEYTLNLTGVELASVASFADINGENNFAFIRSIKVETCADGGVLFADLLKEKAVSKSPAKTPAKAPAKKSARKSKSDENSKILLSSTFKKSLNSWSSREYWGGKLSRNDADMVLEATAFKGKHWGRALGVRPRRTEFAGRRFRLTVFAKGSGDIYPGFLVTYPKSAKLKRNTMYAKSEKPGKLSEKYRPYTFEADFSDSAPLGVTPIVEVRGENSMASIRMVRMEAISGKGAEMSVVSPLAVVEKNSAAPAREFKFSKADATVQTMQFAANGSSEIVIQPEISNDKGLIKVPVQGKVADLTKIIASAEGAYAVSYALGIDKAVYKRLDSVAKKIKADKPLSILYLGDSLNDFDRGYNSVDQAAAFLHKYNPGKFNIFNYSVAGDYITRVEERLLGKRADKRFTGIFDRPYDLVIISLGNNDTRATSKGNYDNPLVPVKEIKPAFERVIEILRKANPGVPVWLLSASRSDSDKMVEKSNKATAAGKTGIRFGIAKHAENFNKAVQETVASGKDLRYIDIYTPMCKEFDPANYADGVHLSIKGHSLFAELLLKAFVK